MCHDYRSIIAANQQSLVLFGLPKSYAFIVSLRGEMKTKYLKGTTDSSNLKLLLKNYKPQHHTIVVYLTNQIPHQVHPITFADTNQTLRPRFLEVMTLHHGDSQEHISGRKTKCKQIIITSNQNEILGNTQLESTMCQKGAHNTKLQRMT